jgi:hypothetical protein
VTGAPVAAGGPPAAAAGGWNGKKTQPYKSSVSLDGSN